MGKKINEPAVRQSRDLRPDRKRKTNRDHPQGLETVPRRQRDPFFHNGTRVNLVQVWDHEPDGSITFNLLYTFEQNEKIVQKEIFEEHYHPFPLRIVKEKLSDLGYEELSLRPFPCDIPETDFEKMEWYRVIARKTRENCMNR